MSDEQIIDEKNRFEPSTGVIPTLSPLTVELEDGKLLKYVNSLETAMDKHWNAAPGKDGQGINLKERRKQNLKYLFGKQLIGKDLKKYESEFLDNIIYESESILKSLAVSKMPDTVIEAGGVETNPEREMTADLLTKVFDKVIDSDKNRNDLGMMFKHMPAYFLAVKKYRWNVSKDKNGDYDEEVVNPDHVMVDHTCLTSNPDDMLVIIHYVEKTGKEWVMLFPDKEEEIIKHAKLANPAVGADNDDVLLAQKIRVAEVWYDWIDKAKDFDAKTNPKFEFYSGVCWKLSKEVLLGKSKNPNWDYEGHDVTTLDGQPVPPDVMEQIILTGQDPVGLKTERVFNNYFKFPRKPFIFMTFDQFLRSAIDETSRIEQQVPLQKSMDDVERQTDHMVKNHKGKHIWGSDSGMTKNTLKNLDMNNPDVDVIVKGNPNNVHAFIQPTMPPAEMFNHIRNRKDRMFAKVGAHGATRGEVTTDVATTNQISREGDFTKNDDLVNATILHVVTESLKARLHIMKLRYTPEHWQKLAGIEAGKYLSLRLSNDSIDDGMEVTITASTTDKLRAERNAQNMANSKMTEPYYYYKDMGIPDPEGRAEALYLYNSNPAMWYEKIVKGKSLPAVAAMVSGAIAPPPEQQAPEQPTADPNLAPQAPSPTDTSNIPTDPGMVPAAQPNMLQKAMSGIKSMLGR